MRKQKSWFDRLSQTARWRLGAKEAEEVIADYRDVVGSPPRLDEELVQNVGNPQSAVNLLVAPKSYHVWLGVFTALAACIFIFGTSRLAIMNYNLWIFSFEVLHLGRIPIFLGAVGAIVWFRWKGYKSAKLPRAVPIVLAFLTVWLVFLLAVNWMWMHDPAGFSAMWGEMPVYVLWVRIGPPGHVTSRSFHYFTTVLMWYCEPILTVLGIVALVKARERDRRWAAVYVLAMAAILVSLETLGLLEHLSNAELLASSWPDFSATFYTYAAFTAVGLLGTGVALC